MRYVTAGLLLNAVFVLPALADPRTDCPSPVPCKVMTLTVEEEKILLDERGILATAATARSLDLAALVVYFQQKIAKAPAGDVPKKEPEIKSVGDPVPAETGGTKPAK
jgi:hypothetical protein